MATVIRKDNMKSVLTSVHNLVRQEILVGIPGADLSRAPEPGTNEVITNAEIGYRMEFGVPAERIPPRPTLIPAITEAFPHLKLRLKKAAVCAINADDKGTNDQLEACGIEAQLAVKKKINSNVPPPLRDSTIAKRLARGVTRTNTLVDTAQFREAITYIRRVK